MSNEGQLFYFYFFFGFSGLDLQEINEVWHRIWQGMTGTMLKGMTGTMLTPFTLAG